MASSGASQSEHILRHLREVGPLTPLEALDLYGCFRLGARIWDLKRDGHPIESQIVYTRGKHYARYFLPKGQLSLFQMKRPEGVSQRAFDVG